MLHTMMKFVRKNLEQEMVFINRQSAFHRYKLFVDENKKVVDHLGPVGLALSLEPKIELNAIHDEHVMLKCRACNEWRIGKLVIIFGSKILFSSLFVFPLSPSLHGHR